MIFRPKLRIFLLIAAVLTASPAAVAAPGRELIAQAERALKKGDGLAAETAVRRALEAGSPRSGLAVLAGEAELLNGDLVAARKWLEPRNFTPANRERGFRALARLEIEQGNLGAAAKAYDAALAAGPASAELWVDIGRLRYRSGQHHLALAAADKALEPDDHEPRALEFRGQIARDAAGPVDALFWFEKGVEQAPDDLSLLGEYAATLAEAGRSRDMLRIARRMVEIDPDHPRAYFLQAVLAARAGHDGLAQRLLDRTNGAYSETPSGRLLAGILEFGRGNPDLAAAQFEALSRSQPDNAEAMLLLGRALLASGEASEVVSRFGIAAERRDASPYLLTLVGRAYEQLGERLEAARFLDRAGGPRPAAIAVLASAGTPPGEGSIQSAVSQVRNLLAQGRRGEAMAAASLLGRQYPESSDVDILGGDVALLAGNPPAALAAYSRAADVRRDFSLIERMAAAHRMLGNESEAKELLAAFLIQHPRSVSAASMLGRLESQGGNWRSGSGLLDFANKAGGGRDPLLLADLAASRFQNDEDAVKTARRAHQLQRSNLRVTATLARILEERGERAQAEALTARLRQTAASPEPARR